MKHIIDTDELEKLPKTWIEGQYYVNKDDLRQLLANSPQADGMVLVPIEPTFEMLEAGADAYETGMSSRESKMYKAMLSVAKKNHITTNGSLYEVVESIKSAIVFSSRDWSLDNRDAWIYALAVGWDDALEEVASKHLWTDEEINRINRYRTMLSAYKPQADDVRKDAWISVEDKPMPTDKPFLSYRNGIVRSCYFYLDMFDKVALGGVGWSFPDNDMPTHWQPLPSPPLDKARE